MSSGAIYYGGCEGGASHSSLVIVDQAGNVVGEASGEGTNSCIVGECCLRCHYHMCLNTFFSVLRDFCI